MKRKPVSLKTIGDLVQSVHAMAIAQSNGERARYAEIMAVITGIRAEQDSELRKANQQLLDKITEQAKYIHQLEGWREPKLKPAHFRPDDN